VVAGCSTTADPSADSSATVRTTAPTPVSGPALPAIRRWHPSVGDLAPSAKAAAVREVERRGNGAGVRLHVIDAQYGGLLDTTASVLVVCRTWRTTAHGLASGGSTYDVRLAVTRSRWKVVAVRPSHPGPAAEQLDEPAHDVLSNGRIDLPPAARADVLSGLVHDSVLTALLSLSARWRIGVSVLRSGHPIYVFGTDRLSDHPQGRAFDTWRIDDHPVVDPATPERLVRRYMEAAAEAGSYNVGGPYLLGSAPQFFSDDTHHDHVHAGFASAS
jgi:hypothetical protein